jgi:Pectinacetylesterase
MYQMVTGASVAHSVKGRSEMSVAIPRFGTRGHATAMALVLAAAAAISACDAKTGSDALSNQAMPTAGTAGGLAPTAGSAGSAGSFGTAGTDASAGSAGFGDTAGMDALAGSGGSDAPTMIGDFINLAPPMGAPLTPEGATTISPAPPAGWTWYELDNTFCRDGSKNGLYVRHAAASDKLLIYFEGGGACTTKGFCHFNPKNVNEILSGDGESVLGSTLAVVAGRQQPGAYTMGTLSGIFDDANAQNPYKGWNMVYIPYCTGDVHFGSNDAGMVHNVPEPQKFVGYKNTREFMSRIVPTFKGKVDRVIVTGASAGSFGAALNMSMIGDSFAGTQVDAVLDSGAPFDDAQWPACLQQSWRELWKLNDSFPEDCTECFAADGGGMLGLADFLIRKHSIGNIAVVSAIHDEVIRLFFAPGQNDCATIKTADPFEITTSQIVGGTIFPADDYEAGLLGLRAAYEGTGRLSTYYFGGAKELVHQHTFRARFYESVAGGKTIAQFSSDFLAGTMQQVGP